MWLLAAIALAKPACPLPVVIAYPGLAQVCSEHQAEGIVLASSATLAVGALASLPEEHPGRALARLSLQDSVTTSLTLALRDSQLRQGASHTPPERLGRLVLAPVSRSALRWDVALGSLSLAAGAVTLSTRWQRAEPAEPTLLGEPTTPGLAAAGATALNFSTFSQVAVAEELLFRGTIQSALARHTHPAVGVWGGAVIFGGAHALNMVSMDAADRLSYAQSALPYLALVGLVAGRIYQSSGYRLAGAVALHFWYDVLLSAAVYAFRPEASPFATTTRSPL